MSCWPILTVAIVPGQVADVRELGVVQDTQTRDRRWPTQKPYAASATGRRP
jgi:hypothetical protein